MALLGSANDKAENVRDSIFNGLLDISRKQPELTLSSCLQFVKNGVRVSLSLTRAHSLAS